MRKSTAVEILARRLGVARSRIENLAKRMADDGLVSKTEGSRRYPLTCQSLKSFRWSLA